MTIGQEDLVELEIQEMLGKSAFRPVPSPIKDLFVSNVFIVDKKDGDHRPLINLNNLNKFNPSQHFKAEGFNSLRDILKDGDVMCKLYLKDTYFNVSFNPQSRILIKFL